MKYTYPPLCFARRREWVILPTSPVPVPVLVPVPVPVRVLVPVPVPGVWFVLKNLDLGGRRIDPRGWHVRGAPPKTFQNQ